MCSSPPVRAPKLQLAVEQPLTGGHWNPPKNDTPHPKTKQQPQLEGRRGAITMKLYPTPTGWVTHRLENHKIKEVLTLLWRFWTTRQASQPGDATKGLEIPKVSDLASQWYLIIGLPEDWGKQILQCWRTQTKFCLHQDPMERSSDPTGDWTKAAC